MALPARHLARQTRVLAALGGTAAQALLARVRPVPPAGPVTFPGPELTAQVPAPAPALVRDYLRHLGGDPAAYRGTVPAHLFPQWTFPLAARLLRGLPYPLLRVVNAGCRLEINAPLDGGGPFTVRARLEGAGTGADARRVVLHQRLVTGTPACPEAVVAHVYAVVGLGGGGGGRPARVRVPEGARELARWRLGPEAARTFALLTGDVNPLHWLRPYARALGYRGTILHGFATVARAMEGLHRSLFAGAVTRIRIFDVKLTRPLVLPARVGLYLDGHAVYVGDAPGGPAYLAGECHWHDGPAKERVT